MYHEVDVLRQGIATQCLSEELHALYSHCYVHALNLAVRDTIKQVKLHTKGYTGYVFGLKFQVFTKA